RQRRDHGVVADVLAVICLDAPERDDVARRHAVALADRVEQRLVLDIMLLGALAPRRRDDALDILREGQRQLGLGVVELDDVRDRLHAGESAIERLGGDALRHRILAHALEPGREIRGLRIGGLHIGGLGGRRSDTEKKARRKNQADYESNQTHGSGIPKPWPMRHSARYSLTRNYSSIRNSRAFSRSDSGKGDERRASRSKCTPAW